MSDSTSAAVNGLRLRFRTAVGGVHRGLFASPLAGMGWGWQVQHDRTLVWALAQHVLFLASMSLFGL